MFNGMQCYYDDAYVEIKKMLCVKINKIKGPPT